MLHRKGQLNNLKIYVNHAHQEVVEDDDYFINSLEYNGQEITDIQLKTNLNIPYLKSGEFYMANEIDYLDGRTLLNKANTRIAIDVINTDK